MEDEQWIREQLRFATCLGNMLNESDIQWSKELDFGSLYGYYEDEFEDMEDDEEF
jgi:hypothetical protein